VCNERDLRKDAGSKSARILSQGEVGKFESLNCVTLLEGEEACNGIVGEDLLEGTSEKVAEGESLKQS
jgi:hypothetical protein